MLILVPALAQEVPMSAPMDGDVVPHDVLPTFVSPQGCFEDYEILDADGRTIAEGSTVPSTVHRRSCELDPAPTFEPDTTYTLEVLGYMDPLTITFTTTDALAPPLSGFDLALDFGGLSNATRYGRGRFRAVPRDPVFTGPDHAPYRLMTNFLETRDLSDHVLSDDWTFCARPLARSWSGVWAEGPETCETLEGSACSTARPSGGLLLVAGGMLLGRRRRAG